MTVCQQVEEVNDIEDPKADRYLHFYTCCGYCEAGRHLGCNHCTTSHCISTDVGPLLSLHYLTTGISTEPSIPTDRQHSRSERYIYIINLLA